MKSQYRLNLVCRGVVVLSVVLAGSAQAASLGAIAEEKLEPSQLVLQPFVGFERAALTVEGPAGYVVQRAFGPGATVRFALFDGEGRALPDGGYRYSLRLTPGPANSSDVQKGLFFVNEGSGVSRSNRRDQLASIRKTLNREQERRLQARQQQGFSPLSSETVGATPSPQTVTPPASYSLSIDGDFALGGYVFKEGKPFIHNDGGYTYANTALGLDALVSATPGSPFYFSGSNNTAVGQWALQYNSSGYRNTATGVLALASNTTGGNNTGSGSRALFSNTTGFFNTANGSLALFSNTAGSGNTASGFLALISNTTGYDNIASGYGALSSNTTGFLNTASGARALLSNTTGRYNTASGETALASNTTGHRNIGLGRRAGVNATTGSDNIWIGHYGLPAESNTLRIGNGTGADSFEQNRAFISGIRSITTGQADAITVVIDSNGQLGTISSSRRVKKQIADMGEASSDLLYLRPVTFKYKQEPVEGEQALQFGLVAEEVAEVLPDLVVYDEEGQPDAVRYHLLSSLLLNELQKQHRLNQAQGEQLKRLRERLARLEALSPP